MSGLKYERARDEDAESIKVRATNTRTRGAEGQLRADRIQGVISGESVCRVGERRPIVSSRRRGGDRIRQAISSQT